MAETKKKTNTKANTSKKKNLNNAKKTPVKKVTVKTPVKVDKKKPTKKVETKKSTQKKTTTKKVVQKKSSIKKIPKKKPVTVKKQTVNKKQTSKKTITIKEKPKKIETTQIEIKLEEKKDDKRLFTFGHIIIAIIIFITCILFGITGTNTLKKISQEDKYNKKVKIIIKAAYMWAEENNIDVPTHITVNRLIKDKYLTPDEQNGNYYNPRQEDKLLNCNTIYIDKENSKYEITFNEETDCNLMLGEQLPIELIAKVASGRDIKSSEQVGADIVLVIYTKLTIEKITWYDDGKLIESYNNSNSFIVTTNKQVYKTIRVIVETNRGTKEFKFVANIKKL